MALHALCDSAYCVASTSHWQRIITGERDGLRMAARHDHCATVYSNEAAGVGAEYNASDAVDARQSIFDPDGSGVIAVIFEVWPAEGRAAEYFDLAAALRSDLETMDGFLSIERFQSLTNPGKYLSLSFWRDEEAVRAWRNMERHRLAQARGRGGVFADYRLRVAAVLRDYGMHDRHTAPDDSRGVHG